jgi:hypothetical protein
MPFSIDITVNAFNLSSICVDLSQFLIIANFKNERSASKFVNGIVRYNLSAIYTFEKTSISCRSYRIFVIAPQLSIFEETVLI